jgi:two-component system CheB/CheR fusion protein
MAVLQVRDTGVGMPPELLPRVFDLFTQANRTPERAEGGLGIGLTLVRRLVELHGGTVEASSAGPGQGSTFTVRLPLATGDAAPAEFPVAIPGKVPSRYRILVVEDNVDAAETLAELLQLWDHQVQMAHTGTAGLDAVRTFQPDVVLLDIGLAGMNGLEVARHIRADGSLPQPLLVALTGYGQESDRQLAREAGFDHHLTKPVDPVVLQQVLASHRP